MPAVTARAGMTVAEMVVALVLAGVLAAAAGNSLALLVRTQHERAVVTAVDDAAQLVRDVLRAELAHADADIRLFGDTTVQLASLRVAATACDASSDWLVLPAGASAWSMPRTGDSLAVADTAQSDWRTTVLSVRAERPSSACPAGGTHLVLSTAPPATVLPRLLPARVWRVVRYALYRAGDGTWWMGERSCTAGCSSAQPIAGPLLAPSQGGLRLALVVGSDGQPVGLDASVRAMLVGRETRLSARLPLSMVR